MDGVTRTSNKLVAYAQITSTQTGFGTTTTDVAGLSVTFTAPGEVVWLVTHLPYVKLNTAAGAASLWLADGSNQVVGLWQQTLTIGAITTARHERRLSILTPGASYTFKVRAQAPTSATMDVGATADAIPTGSVGPAYIRVIKE